MSSGVSDISIRTRIAVLENIGLAVRKVQIYTLSISRVITTCTAGLGRHFGLVESGVSNVDLTDLSTGMAIHENVYLDVGIVRRSRLEVDV